MEKTTKLLGGWGYIAAIVFGFIGGFIPPFGGLLALAGTIVVLVAYFRAAGEYGKPEIRTNAIISIVLGIAGVVVFMVFVGASIFTLLLHRGSDAGAGFTGGLIAGAIITWILWIVATWFWYKASAALGEASGQNLFKIGGLLIFIGSITIIVFGLGGLVMLIGEILQTVGFFSTPEKSEVAPRAPDAAI